MAESFSRLQVLFSWLEGRFTLESAVEKWPCVGCHRRVSFADGHYYWRWQDDWSWHWRWFWTCRACSNRSYMWCFSILESWFSLFLIHLLFLRDLVWVCDPYVCVVCITLRVAVGFSCAGNMCMAFFYADCNENLPSSHENKTCKREKDPSHFRKSQ